ncbi:hypothetical protein QFC21_005513 [Naganishia friedmannii]|uniref:Uncharacterized protein n=1 Tax=Naganishia friedmannii TaxID=89922 RepID=A0ACC2V9V8_9TREE|nr:hypothetical protein QFC21_005513 [Naganishia friedmannii]
MATSTIVPAAMFSRHHCSSKATIPQPQSLQSVRLEVLTASSPFSTIREISEIIIVALELGTPIWDNIIPSPRAPLEVQIARVAKQHLMQLKDPKSDKIYVRAVGVLTSGEECTVGVAIWQKPGVRYHTLNLEELSEDDREGFEGYDMVFRDAFYGGFQHYRDKLMGDAPYWYLSILAVHPDYQNFKIGSKLLDHGLQHYVIRGDGRSDTETRYPTLLEATPAGERLYKSRGFVKEDEFTLAEQSPGMEKIRFPLYRKPADA